MIAFTGKTIAADDVATVLGLVGRDLLLDAVQAVADEDAPAAFELAGRAVEMGYDLRARLPRAVARRARSARAVGRSVARRRSGDRRRRRARSAEGARPRRFSREDLLRAFDLLTRAEFDIRSAAQPRYHLEMALLRWIHLRKLVPIEDLIAGGSRRRRRRRRARAAPRRRASGPRRRCAGPAPPAPAPRRRAPATPRGRARRRRRPRRDAGGRQPRRPARRRASDRRRRRLQGCAARGDPQVEGGVLQHGRRAGAEDRGRRRSRHVHASRRRSARCATVRAAPGVARSRSRSRLAGRKMTVVAACRPTRRRAAGRRRRRRQAPDAAVDREEVDAARAGARRRRRPGDARSVSGGNPRRRGNVGAR